MNAKKKFYKLEFKDIKVKQEQLPAIPQTHQPEPDF